MEGRADPTLQAAVHGIGAFGAIFAVLIAMFVHFFVFRREPRWRSLRWPSLAAGVAAAGLTVVGPALPDPPETALGDGGWLGIAASRLFFAVMVGWLLLVAMRLRSTADVRAA